MASSGLAPQRCFLFDLPNIFNAQKDSKTVPKVRVMGMVTAITPIPNTDEDDDQEDEQVFSYCMMDQENNVLLELDDGTGTVSCVATVAMVDRLETRVGQTLDCIGELKTNPESLFVIQADTLLEVPRNHKDPSVAERLRWLEIVHRDKISAFGYPCPEVSSNEILEMIESNNGEGVSVKDLALVMDLHPQHVQSLIEELQIQGLIYEKEAGSFVPL